MKTLHRYGMLTTIILLSILFRVVYYIQLQEGPCIWQHRWTETDMNYFDAWGQQIAAGDWLSKSVAVPMHGWHVNLAAGHLMRHPEQLAALQTQAANDPDPDRNRAVARALWTNWSGGKTFYQDPLYPYLIGMTYKFFGPDPRWVFLWQMLAGVMTNVLIFLIARRCFGPVVANVAGLLATFCSPLLYYELILLRGPLMVMMSLLLVGLTLQVIKYRQWRWWFLFGAVWGLAVLLKSTFALLGLGLLAGLTGTQWRKWRALLPGVGVALGSLVLALTPLVIRNLIVGAPPLALASGGAITFIFHNAQDYDASMHVCAEFGSFHVSPHAARIMGDSEGRFFPSAIETLKTHTPGSYFRQLSQKFTAVWHWFEIPNNANFYLYRMYAWILYLPATFALIGPLGVVGLLLGLSHGRKAWPLYVLVLASLIPLLVFYVSSRLRLPLVAGLISFAALTIVQTIHWIRARRILLAALALGGIFLATIAIDRPLPKGIPHLRCADCAVPFLDTYYGPRIQDALKNGDLPKALLEYRTFLKYEPDFIRQFGPGRGPESLAKAKIANFYAFRYREYAGLLELGFQAQQAKTAKARADELGVTLRPFVGKTP